MEQQNSNDLWQDIRHDLEQELSDRGYDATTILNVLPTDTPDWVINFSGWLNGVILDTFNGGSGTDTIRINNLSLAANSIELTEITVSHINRVYGGGISRDKRVSGVAKTDLDAYATVE